MNKGEANGKTHGETQYNVGLCVCSASKVMLHTFW